MPVHLCQSAQPGKGQRWSAVVAVLALTIVLSKTAKVLVEVECRRAVAQLDIGQPLGDDVQERSVKPDSSAYERNHYPALRRVV